MKKLIGFTMGIAVLTAAAYYFKLFPFASRAKQEIHIAVAGPMTGKHKEKGAEMLRGVQTALDEFTQTGRLKNLRVILDVFDDRNKSTAVRIASQIADEQRAILVIGHFDSDKSIAAGAIYNKTGIPAITASAAADEVISNNDWYFRLIPSSSYMAHFMLQYAKSELNSNGISLLYDKNEYRSSIISVIEKEAVQLGMSSQNKWEYDSEDPKVQNQLFQIIGKLTAAADPGIILAAADDINGAYIIASTRYPGTNLSVIGTASFSTPTFIRECSVLETKWPGFFTNGVYAVVPFLADLADKEHSLNFRQKFAKRYDKDPSWIAAGYYDAMRIALEGIDRGEIQFKDIREDRRRVRDAITRFNSPDVAVRGVTGDIWFDSKRNTIGQSLSVGFWQSHVFVPAYAQYRQVDSLTTRESLLQYCDPKVNQVLNQLVEKEKIVYVGIDICDIKNIDIENGTFTADFYIWFRFEGEVDLSQINFDNAVTPVLLTMPILHDKVDNVTTSAYRVVNDFTFEAADTDTFPFDHHHLYIRLQHKTMQRRLLTFVPDMLGLDINSSEKNKAYLLTPSISDWFIRSVSFPQQIKTVHVSDTIPLSYSVNGIDIQIQRKHAVSLCFKIFILIVFMSVLLYFSYLLPPDHIAAKSLILIPVLITAGVLNFIHQEHRLIQHAVYAVYALCALSFILNTGLYQARSGKSAERFITQTGRIIHTTVLVAAILYISYSYYVK